LQYIAVLLADSCQHLQRAYLDEYAALLPGHNDGDCGSVYTINTMKNTFQPGYRNRRQQISHHDLLHAQKQAAYLGCMAIDSVHSHPGRRTRPSTVHLQHALPFISLLIARGRQRIISSKAAQARPIHRRAGTARHDIEQQRENPRTSILIPSSPRAFTEGHKDVALQAKTAAKRSMRWLPHTPGRCCTSTTSKALYPAA